MVSPIFHGKCAQKCNVPQTESRVTNSSAGCRYANLGLSCERNSLPSEEDTRHWLGRSWPLEFIIYKLLGKKTAACKNCWLCVRGIICYAVMEQHCWFWEEKKLWGIQNVKRRCLWSGNQCREWERARTVLSCYLLIFLEDKSTVHKLF